MVRVDITAVLSDGSRVAISETRAERHRAVSTALDRLPEGAIPLSTLVTDTVDLDPIA